MTKACKTCGIPKPLFISGKFPFLPISPEFNNEDFGIVTLDTAIPETDEEEQ